MSKHGLLNHFYTQAAMKTKFDRAVNVIIAPGNSDFDQNAWIISSSLVERRARSLSVLRLARECKNLSATLGDCRKRRKNMINVVILHHIVNLHTVKRAL